MIRGQLSDYIVIICYIAGIFLLAWKGQIKSAKFSAKNMYLAGQSLTLKESLLSIIATETSALTFLGIPAFCYTNNFSFLLIYIGAIFGRLVIAKIFLPLIYNKGLTIYEVIGAGEHSSARKTLSVFFIVSKILSVGVRLYSGSILVAEFLQLPLSLAIILIATLTFFYTIIGGLKAVVATDNVQFFIFLGGGLLAHYFIPRFTLESGWWEMMNLAHGAGKTALLSFDVNGVGLFFLGIAGGFLFDMATHGVDQDYSQRLMACKDLPTAQKAIFYSSFVSVAMGLIFLGVGALLWSFFQLHPLPIEVAPDHLFSYFITEYFPSPLKGLMMAGILAATMSTLDSTLNALSACLWNDVFPQSKNHQQESSRYLFSFSILVSLVSVALLARLSDELLLLGLKIASWTGGPLLAIFLLRVVFKVPMQFTPMRVVQSYLGGFLGVALNTFVIKANWNFNIYIGLICSMMAVFLHTGSKAIDKKN